MWWVRMSEWQCLMSVECPEISAHDTLRHVIVLSLPHQNTGFHFLLVDWHCDSLNIIIFVFTHHYICVTFAQLHYSIFSKISHLLERNMVISPQFVFFFFSWHGFMSRQPIYLLWATQFAFRFAQYELVSWMEWKHSYCCSDGAF